ncbi:PREDICTED: MCM domain-containing protein 2-like [Priapulus caudatus]|uniref:MCM domain-containing protein 2-like n=1 Tax=Priapulus caudatus TaxID=37621 RepID=A0ABM1ETW1_PRICU|nr:PREDICTED: MCM domain-containing protein 2-like [Priapulus caudatus]
MSLAEAHAKLSLRREVAIPDAVMAILLYEESITARYGYSVLSVKPSPHCRDSNIGVYLGPENDQRMLQFQQQLIAFIASHAGDLEFREE